MAHSPEYLLIGFSLLVPPSMRMFIGYMDETKIDGYHLAMMEHTQGSIQDVNGMTNQARRSLNKLNCLPSPSLSKSK